MNYANLMMYTDIRPFEIIRRVSELTLEIREMNAVIDNSFQPEFDSGGFAGHCINQSEQRYSYSSDLDAPVIRARLRKDGFFWSKLGMHRLSSQPIKFYVYNF